MKNNKLVTYFRDFLEKYLRFEKGSSHDTILNYRGAIKLLFSYVANQKKKSITGLNITDFRPNMVINFLDYLEKERNNSIQSRNSRLTCIRGFFNYLARVNEDPSISHRCYRIAEIPFKPTTQNPVMDYLEIKEMKAILEAIDRRTKSGCRDYALLSFMYNTGARVGEVVNLRVKALKLKKPFAVKILGEKEGKERQCPLRPETVEALRSLIYRRELNPQADVPIFVTHRGQPLGRTHIRYLLNKYVNIASEKCPSLKQKRIYPNTIRHRYALALMQANVDTNTIATWLGHKSPEG